MARVLGAVGVVSATAALARLSSSPLSSSSLFLLSPPLQHCKVLKAARLVPCFASSEEKTSSETTSDPPPPPASPPPSDKKTQAREAVEKGQKTAIITGAIAVVLGIGYLVLVQLLDSRGVNLVPPPPEAFEM